MTSPQEQPRWTPYGYHLRDMIPHQWVRIGGMPYALPEHEIDSVNALEADLKALRTENETLRAKAALADEEWGGSYMRHFATGLGRGRMECKGCGMMNGHTEKCRKARYDALTTPETEKEQG